MTGPDVVGPPDRPDAAGTPGLPGRAESPDRPDAADGDWHRVHPISPWVRGWVVLVGLLFVATQSVGEDLVRSLVGAGQFQAAEGLWMTLVVYGAVFVVMVIAYYFSWRFTKYRLTEEQVLLDTGVVFRQHRRVRYDRVQAVDIRQPLLARVFGLAELRFEAADGGQTALQLAFIRDEEARVLRAEIMGRAAGIQAGAPPAETARHGAAVPRHGGTGPDTHRGGHPDSGAGTDTGVGPGTTTGGTEAGAGTGPGGPGAGAGMTEAGDRPETRLSAALREAPEQVMLQVPVPRLVGSLLLSSGMAWMAGILLALVAGAVVADRLLPPVDEGSWTVVFLVSIIPFGFSVVGYLWSGLTKGYNFTVATSTDGLRLRYGLLETAQQTVPPGRVQAVGIRQGLFWRPFGWYRMNVNVAGYGAGTEGGGTDKSVVLPVGTLEDVLRVLSVVAPDPGVDEAPDVVRAGVVGRGGDHGFTPSPRRARWLDPLTWQRNAFRSTRTMLMLRSGRLERQLVLMPHERIQSIDIRQGPVDRRLAVARLRFHSTPGPLAPALHHADAAVARRLFLETADTAAVSRRLRDRNQWMRPEELARFEQRTRQVVE